MDMAQLEQDINAAWDDRDAISAATTGAVRDAVNAALAMLDSGTARVAEPQGNHQWHVNQWLKKAVLLSFRLNDMAVIPSGTNYPESGEASWWDKVPSKFAGWGEAEFREAGFRAGLAAHGRELFARGVGDFLTEQAAKAAREMFAGDDIPDAVFVANDHMAFAVLEVLRGELGLGVPEDVSVVGYDDVQLAGWPSFDLTTIRQPSNAMVMETVSALLAQIEEGASRPHRVKIDGPLVVRGSARRPDGWKEDDDEGV